MFNIFLKNINKENSQYLTIRLSYL